METVAALIRTSGVHDERGRQLSLSAPALLRIEDGQRFPSLRTLLALAKVYGIHFIITDDGIEIAEPVS